MSADIDVVIVGAGAAGIAAARRLAPTPLSVLLIEATARIGGRASTCNIANMPLDLGCEWLHSADQNPLVAIARDNGFIVDEGEPGWGAHVGSKFSKKDQKAFRAASAKFWDALEEAADRRRGQ